MKLLGLTSALDLRLPYGCTDEWQHIFHFTLHSRFGAQQVTRWASWIHDGETGGDMPKKLRFISGRMLGRTGRG